MVSLGICLRASPDHPSTVIALDRQSTVAFIGRFNEDDEFVRIVQAQRPKIIAIGTPLGLPSGLCCLEASCPCKPSIPQRKGRRSELELTRMGISCFFSYKGSIVSRLIYRSIELGRRLRCLGLNVIEAYPHATKVILFGDNVSPKNGAASLAFLKERLSLLIDGLDDQVVGFDHHTCTAVLNAYTALLHQRNATDVLGTPEEGMLVLPKLPC